MIEVSLRFSESTGDAQKQAVQRQELLIAELNHRVRNILSLIRGLTTQSDDPLPTCPATSALSMVGCRH